MPFTSEGLAAAIASRTGRSSTPEGEGLARGIVQTFSSLGLAASGPFMAEAIGAQMGRPAPAPASLVSLATSICVTVQTSAIAFSPPGVGVFTYIPGEAMAAGAGMGAATLELLNTCSAIAEYMMLTARVVGVSIVSSEDANALAEANVVNLPESGTTNADLEEAPDGPGKTRFIALRDGYFTFSAIAKLHISENRPRTVGPLRVYAGVYANLGLTLVDDTGDHVLGTARTETAREPNRDVVVSLVKGTEMKAGNFVKADNWYGFDPEIYVEGNPVWGSDGGDWDVGPKFTITQTLSAG